MFMATWRKRGAMLPGERGGKWAGLGCWMGWLVLWTELFPPPNLYIQVGQKNDLKVYIFKTAQNMS